MADSSRRDMLLKAAALAATVGMADQAASQEAPAKARRPRPKGAEKGIAGSNNVRESDPRIDSIVNSANKLLSELKSPAAVSRLNTVPQTLYQRDASSWKQVQDRAAQYYRTKHRDAFESSQVESGYVHIVHPADALFRMQHVEVLLDQAADLLERALGQRSEWNDLGAKAFGVSSELEQYFRLDEIHQEETAKGYYTHDAQQAAGEVLTQSRSQDVLSQQADFLLSLVNQYYSIGAINTQSAYSQLLGWLSHLANYYREANDTQMQYTWNGVPKTSADHAKDAATGTSFQNLFLQAALLQAQGTATYSAGESAGNQAAALKIKSDWEQANISFRMRRTEVARRLADKKAEAYTVPDGALNYPERMRRIKIRFDRDFRDALARMNAIAAGMKIIYGYPESLSSSIRDAIEGKPIEHGGVFDECLVWVRNAISFVIRYSHAEQRYVLPISVRQLIGDDRFKAGSGAHPFASWNFLVTKDLFPDQFNVRVKSANLFVVPREALLPAFQGQFVRGVWTGSVKPPEKSHYQQFQVNGSSKDEPVDQSALPRTFSGRVSTRDSDRDPDTFGGTCLFNASPLGEWNIRMSRSSSEGVSIGDIYDVVMDLAVVVRT